MAVTRCVTGDISKRKDGILFLKITCMDREINRDEMLETIAALDRVAVTPMPLLVDSTTRHSLSYEAMRSMGKAKNIKAVGIFADKRSAYAGASYVETFQKIAATAPYPFMAFANMDAAISWLKIFLE